MIKYLLISVRSEWVYHILNGDKTIELRKVIPNWALESVKKGETVKCLIYCTKAKPYLTEELFLFNISQFDDRLDLNGKIVAQFDLNMIDKLGITDDGCAWFLNGKHVYYANPRTTPIPHILKKACLNHEQVLEYIGYGGDCFTGTIIDKGFLLHIDNLKIFDEPKELTDYMNNFYQSGDTVIENKPITRAPQNMMTVWGWE